LSHCRWHRGDALKQLTPVETTLIFDVISCLLEQYGNDKQKVEPLLALLNKLKILKNDFYLHDKLPAIVINCRNSLYAGNSIGIAFFNDKAKPIMNFFAFLSTMHLVCSQFGRDEDKRKLSVFLQGMCRVDTASFTRDTVLSEMRKLESDEKHFYYFTCKSIMTALDSNARIDIENIKNSVREYIKSQCSICVVQ
jgi:hypothetical protein